MSGARLTVSPEADADLTAISTFIMERDGAARAVAAIEGIQRTMHNLAFMPGMGRHRSYLDAGIRTFPAASWTIFYALKSDGSGIDVVRIIDSRRDLISIFRKPK